jgi:hypothetical protein
MPQTQYSMAYNPNHPNEAEAAKCVWTLYLLVGPNGMHFFKKCLLQGFGHIPRHIFNPCYYARWVKLLGTSRNISAWYDAQKSALLKWHSIGFLGHLIRNWTKTFCQIHFTMSKHVFFTVGPIWLYSQIFSHLCHFLIPFFIVVELVLFDYIVSFESFMSFFNHFFHCSWIEQIVKNMFWHYVCNRFGFF